MATLKDVAKLANVSSMTVSRVLNHPEKVSDELKDSIYLAMKKLGYQPNFAAKALAKNVTQIVKLLILEDMDTTEPYYSNFLVGVSQELNKHHYALQLAQRGSMDIGGCDGYIITGMREPDYQWLAEIQLPVVIFGDNTHGYDCVDIDNQQATVKSTSYAFKCGYQNVVFIGIDLPDPFEVEREAGYQAVVDANHQQSTIYRLENHSHLASEFIKQNITKLRPNTCFVCASDRLAFGVQRGLQAEKALVPADFGVIGFDGVFLNAIATPKITTIKQSLVSMGQQSVKMLLQKIQFPNRPQGRVVYPPELLVGGSTRKEVN